MGNIRYNRNQRDANELALLKVAEQLGGQWVETGPFDGWIFVGRMNRLFRPVEIKLPEREGLANEYTPQQLRVIARFKLIGAPLWIWRTSADVIRDLGAA